MKRFLVIGIGRFGRAVVEALNEARDVEVIAVDEQMGPVDDVRDMVAVAAKVDSLDRAALEAVGAGEVDVAIVGIGEDFEAAVLTVAVLKELGIREIVARARTDRQRRVLEVVGATRVVMVEAEMGRRLARAMVSSHVRDHLEVGEGVSLIQWEADGRVVGRSLRELDLRGRWGLTLVAIKRCPANQRETVTVAPEADYTFQPGDVLLLCGANPKLTAFTR